MRCVTLFAGTQYEIKCRPTSWVQCNKFRSLEILLKIFWQTCNANSRTKSCIFESYCTTLTQSTSAKPPHAPTTPAATNLVCLYMILPSPQTKIYQTTVKQTNNVPRHDSSPNNKPPQSVSHHNPHPSTITTFHHYLYLPE